VKIRVLENMCTQQFWYAWHTE